MRARPRLSFTVKATLALKRMFKLNGEYLTLKKWSKTLLEASFGMKTTSSNPKWLKDLKLLEHIRKKHSM